MDRLFLICTVVAVIPASVLLLFVILIGVGTDQALDKFGSVTDWVTSIAALLTASLAIKAYADWRRPLQAEFDSKFKLSIMDDLYQCSAACNDLYVNLISTKNYFKGGSSTLPEFDNKSYQEMFQVQKIASKAKFFTCSPRLIVLCTNIGKLSRNIAQEHSSFYNTVKYSEHSKYTHERIEKLFKEVDQKVDEFNKTLIDIRDFGQARR